MKKLVSVLVVISMLCSCFSLMAFASPSNDEKQEKYTPAELHVLSRQYAGVLEEDVTVESQLDEFRQAYLNNPNAETMKRYQLAMEKAQLIQQMESGIALISNAVAAAPIVHCPQETNYWCGPAIVQQTAKSANPASTLDQETIAEGGGDYFDLAYGEYALGNKTREVLNFVQTKNDYFIYHPTSASQIETGVYSCLSSYNLPAHACIMSTSSNWKIRYSGGHYISIHFINGSQLGITDPFIGCPQGGEYLLDTYPAGQYGETSSRLLTVINNHPDKLFYF